VVRVIGVGVEVEQAADAVAVGVFDDVGHGLVGGEHQVGDGLGGQPDAGRPVVESVPQLVESLDDGRYADPKVLSCSIAFGYHVHGRRTLTSRCREGCDVPRSSAGQTSC
jgi:hypothetical protein